MKKLILLSFLLFSLSCEDYREESLEPSMQLWVNGDYITLGTDGFGRSDTREELRNYFEISKDHIVINALIVSGNKDKAEKYIKDKKTIFISTPFSRAAVDRLVKFNVPAFKNNCIKNPKFR